jgi:DNA (cytosine-5)-methyltransferase 1
MALNSVELFAGAGGLAMGVALAGFKSRAVVEWDSWACETLRTNQSRGHPLVADWPVQEADVREWVAQLDEGSMSNDLDLVAGGPPCQPFSLGGKHRAFLDERDMFPATVDVIRRLRPRAFIVENVRGLTRSSFSAYFEYILLQLEFPELVRRVEDSWLDHHGRLQAFKTSRRSMPEPASEGSPLGQKSQHLNHRLQPGAKSYPGHTGSPLDLPAKTLKAGDHGVPGGENMLVKPDASVRYFSVRESARLQAFPDGFEIRGSWSEAMRQLGNAVPVTLGQVVASSVASHLLIARQRTQIAVRRPVELVP